jgi:hypothetical protein
VEWFAARSAAPSLSAQDLPAPVGKALEEMGIDPAHLEELGKAKPHLVEAARHLSEGRVKESVGELMNAVSAAPELSTDLVSMATSRVAARLPDDGAGSLGKTLLTDRDFLRTALTDRESREGLKLLGQGQVVEGLRALTRDGSTAQAALTSLSANPHFTEQIGKLGLNADDLKQAVAALPEVAAAAGAAVRGDHPQAIQHLADAAGKAPDLVTKGINAAAQRLPETGAAGMARSLLASPEFVGALVRDPGTRNALPLLAQGKVGEALRGAAGNEAALRAGVDALAANPEFKSALDQMGVTPEALKASADALPSLVDAGLSLADGKVGEALGHLAQAAQRSPELISEVVGTLAERLPAEGPGRFARMLLTDPAFTQAVAGDPKTYEAIGKLAQGQVGDGLRMLSENQTAARAAVDVLAKDPEVKAGMDALGLTAGALKQGVDALPDAVDAVRAAARGDAQGALRSLYEAAVKAPEALSEPLMQQARKLPESGAPGVLRSVLTDPAAVQALISDRAAHQAVGRLIGGDLGALADLSQTRAYGAVTDAILKNPEVSSALQRLQITPQDLREAQRALPDLVNAGVAFSQGDNQAGFRHLKEAGLKLAPMVATRILSNAAATLPDTGPAGIVKSLLTDRAFLDQLFRNPNISDAFDKMMSGEFQAGFKQALRDDGFRGAAGNALANNADLMRMLNPFGVESGRDISELGASVVDLLEAGEALFAGDIQGTLRGLGRAVEDLSPELRTRIVGKFAEKLGLPQWGTDVLMAVGELLGNEDVSRPLGAAIESLRRQDAGGFVKNLAEAGRQVATTAPHAAKLFLNSLGQMPGQLAKLFQDRDLNAAMVDSGAVTQLWDMAEKLATGQIGDALNELGEAGKALIQQGGVIKVGGVELPVSVKGLENMGRLALRFFEVLPNDLKAEIAEAATKAGAAIGLKSIPGIGNIISGVSAVFSTRDLIRVLQDKNADGLDKILAAAQVGLDVAGVVPGLNSFTGPAGLVLSMAKIIKGGHDLITDFKKFQQDMVGLEGMQQAPAGLQREAWAPAIPVLAEDAPRPAPRSSLGWYEFPVQGAAPVPGMTITPE